MIQRLSDRVDRRNNNFDFIRWLAASLVIFSHEYAIHPTPAPEPLAKLTQGFATFGSIGVDVFFIISGFLVVRSMLLRGRLGFFAVSRALRLVPALAVVIAISAFILGPLFTVLPLRDYFANEQTYSYVFNNLTPHQMQWNLPGVFLNNPVPGAVNGSLWSLWPEVEMYVMVFALGALTIVCRSHYRALLMGLGLALAMLIGFAEHGDLAGHTLEPARLARLAPYFGLGGMLYLSRHYLPATGGLPMAVLLMAIVAWRTQAFVPLFDVGLALTVIWFAYAQLGAICDWGRPGDFSYGLYIYAFPIQQSAYVVFPHWTRTSHFLLAYVATTALAAMSWYFVERPGLNFKEKLTPQERR